MKKKIELLFCLCVFVCGMGLTSCSSDDDCYSDQAKATELKSQIMEIAEEYDVEFRIDDGMLLSEVDNINIDSVTDIIKSIALMKGTYTFSKFSGNKCVSLKQNKKIIRTRSESYSQEGYDFGDEEISNGPRDFLCSCSVLWTINKDTKEILTPKVSASIVCSPHSNFHIFTTSSSYGYSAHIDGSCVIFSGSVTCTYGFYSFSVNFRGSCSEDNGSIDWY